MLFISLLNRPCRVATFEIGKKESGTVKHERAKEKWNGQKEVENVRIHTEKRARSGAEEFHFFS